MRRRQFLKYGSAGLVTLAWGASGLPGGPGIGPRRAEAVSLSFTLTIQPVTIEMIDGEEVFFFAFADVDKGPRVPGPVIRVTEGDRVTLTVKNADDQTHAFDIPGVPGSRTGPIPPGTARTITFIAPRRRAGTYLYLDPTNAPVNRVLGLHGAFIIEPENNGLTRAGSPTPYNRAQLTPAVAAVFDALGRTPRFPGDQWNPEDPERERVWVFNQVDPRFNKLAADDTPIDPKRFVAEFLPRYFTINGVSGFDSAHKEANVPSGFIGQPTLIRVLNAGLNTHSPHSHGNHVFELSGVSGGTGLIGAVLARPRLTSTPTAAEATVVVRNNVIERDTWTMASLDRKDVLLPFERPPDIPAAAFPPEEEPFPFRYPIHCHIEMSQTAAGGNYPQGMVTDWEILGPLRSSASRTASVTK